jgi:putative transposase
MTQREIQGHLEEVYGVEISLSLISTVTDEVLNEVRVRQVRPLDAIYRLDSAASRPRNAHHDSRAGGESACNRLLDRLRAPG